MKEERLKVLELLAQGTISAEEAAGLLDALGTGTQQEEDGPDVLEGSLARRPRWLRVEVTKQNEKKVNIRIPLVLLKAGMKLKAMLPDNVKSKVDAEMEEKGFRFRFEDLDKQNLDELIAALSEAAIEVDGDDGERVRIYCE